MKHSKILHFLCVDQVKSYETKKIVLINIPKK